MQKTFVSANLMTNKFCRHYNLRNMSMRVLRWALTWEKKIQNTRCKCYGNGFQNKWWFKMNDTRFYENVCTSWIEHCTVYYNNKNFYEPYLSCNMSVYSYETMSILFIYLETHCNQICIKRTYRPINSFRGKIFSSIQINPKRKC